MKNHYYAVNQITYSLLNSIAVLELVDHGHRVELAKPNSVAQYVEKLSSLLEKEPTLIRVIYKGPVWAYTDNMILNPCSIEVWYYNVDS